MSSSADHPTALQYGTFDAKQLQQHIITKSNYSKLLWLLVLVLLLTCAPVYISYSTTLPYQQHLNALEKLFISIPSAHHARDHLLHYSSKPHSAGTAADYETALYTAEKLQAFGFTVDIKKYDVLLSVPTFRTLQIVAPTARRRQFMLDEDVITHDACTQDSRALPPFIAYSPSANVTGHIVYVNYGSEGDFALLLQRGIPLAGHIALARYGQNFRGLKVLLAQQHGMIGVLIYSDPADDGFARGKVYPEGPWRPASSVQRGSGQFMSLYPGDPLTPGYASVEGAPRLNITDVTNLPTIPVFPLSYGNAIHLLRGLVSSASPAAPAAWQGALDVTYHHGPTDLMVNLNLIVQNKVGPIWNVLGKIEGSHEKDRYVLLGNHRDSWVCGAIDPNSGSAAMLEIARGFGTLLQTGWKPRRSIVLGSWDGEEYGLIGSTEWAEEFSADLYQNAVAYLNVDCFHGNSVFAQGSPAIAEFILSTSKAIPNLLDADHDTLYDAWMARFHELQTSTRRHSTVPGTTAVPGTVEPPHPINILGSGTDFTPFYQHLGIVSANLGFDEATYGVYHSSMDSIRYVDLYGDPAYAAHVTTARWWGLLALRLADDTILPFDYRTYGLVLHRYIDEFQAETDRLDLQLNFTHVRSASTAFLAQADRLFETKPESITDIGLHNDKLMRLERQFLSPTGLLHRPWYKHLIFGPGFYTGYGATAFPGLADALSMHDSRAMFRTELDHIHQAITSATQMIQDA